MKKLLILAFILLACILASFYPKNEKQIVQMFSEGTYTIYLNNQLNKIENSSVSRTNLGDGEILSCKVTEVSSIYDSLIGKKSECVTIAYDEQVLQKVLQQITVKKTEKYDTVKIYYGYKKGLPNKIKIDGYLINIAVYVLQDCIKIASPIILTSF